MIRFLLELESVRQQSVIRLGRLELGFVYVYR